MPRDPDESGLLNPSLQQQVVNWIMEVHTRRQSIRTGGAELASLRLVNNPLKWQKVRRYQLTRESLAPGDIKESLRGPP